MPPTAFPMCVNRLLTPVVKAVAPMTIASAIKTTSIAYSVAVAPLSSLRKLLIRLSISRSLLKEAGSVAVSAEDDHSRHSADAQINSTLSVRCPAQRQKTAFFNNFIILDGKSAVSDARGTMTAPESSRTGRQDNQVATAKSRILSNYGEIWAR